VIQLPPSLGISAWLGLIASVGSVIPGATHRPGLSGSYIIRIRPSKTYPNLQIAISQFGYPSRLSTLTEIAQGANRQHTLAQLAAAAGNILLHCLPSKFPLSA